MRFGFPIRRSVRLIYAAMAGFLAAGSAATGAGQDRLTIYIDADYTHLSAPAEAIETGLRTALAETWAEDLVTILPRDHRANARRSFDNIRDAVADQTAIAVVGGMHSPPYLIHGAEINAAGMPLLLPWSAGGPITRLADGADNWIFRLSVDDTKAGAFLLDAAQSAGCAKIGLIVLDNPWGNGNANRIREIAAAQGGTPPPVVALPLEIGVETAGEAAMKMVDYGADCVIFVSELKTTAHVLTALAAFDTPPMVFSHWGILGRPVNDYISASTREAVSLSILGTCGMTRALEHEEVHAAALRNARELRGDAFTPEALVAAHGFYHGHDLGLLMIAALDEARQTAEWKGGIADRRAAFRRALYGLDSEIEGLLKNYQTPFRPNSAADRDGHEALSGEDLCLTSFNAEGYLRPLVSGRNN